MRAGFRLLADREPERIAMIDADRAEAEVAAAVWATVSDRLDLRR